jgi:hypothetical protein
VSDLELYVIRENIARFTRLLDTETDERTRSLVSALLHESQEKLKTALAARHSAVASVDKS